MFWRQDEHVLLAMDHFSQHSLQLLPNLGDQIVDLAKLTVLFILRVIRRRTTAAKAQTSRAPGPSTSGMMRIYTDDSPGLRV